jgi:nucleoside-diphosphate-sugar epimerase
MTTTPTRIALTGASGFIGHAIAQRLAKAGHLVTALVRASSRRDHLEAHVDRFVVGDQADASAWPALLEGASCVIHNAHDWRPLEAHDLDAHLASNVVAAIRLLHAAVPRRFIYMSTIGVHHDMRPRWAGLIDEDHPLRPASPYGAGKAAVEAHLWAAHVEKGIEVCALRPCGVYGIDPDLSRSIGYPIIERLKKEKRFARAGGGKFVHVDDVAAAALGAVEMEKLGARVVNLVDCYARWADWATMAAEFLGIDATIDTSSPPRPKNEFAKDAAQALGAACDRGHAGIREHLAVLARAIGQQPCSPRSGTVR